MIIIHPTDFPVPGMPPKEDVVWDVEFALTRIKASNADPVIQKLMLAVDSATPNNMNNIAVNGKFGLITLLQLSTGCQAAIVAHLYDKPVWLGEAGWNAIDALFSYVPDAEVLMACDRVYIHLAEDAVANTYKIGERTFDNIEDLNNYIEDVLGVDEYV